MKKSQFDYWVEALMEKHARHLRTHCKDRHYWEEGCWPSPVGKVEGVMAKHIGQKARIYRTAAGWGWMRKDS